MKHTNSVVGRSLVNQMVASKGAILLAPGQDQVMDTCTQIVSSQGRLQVEQVGHIGSPNQGVVKGLL